MLGMTVLSTLVEGLVIGGALRTAAESFCVQGTSMCETLQPNDRLLGERLTLRGGSVGRGSIVAFTDPEDSRRILIKRIIAVGGQQVDLVDGRLIVDGITCDEPYAQRQATLPLAHSARCLADDISYPYQVPTGSVWVLGDNRSASRDSRRFGAIPSKAITPGWQMVH